VSNPARARPAYSGAVPQRASRGPTLQVEVWKVLLAAALAGGAFLRFCFLGKLPLTAEEASRAWGIWAIVHDNAYQIWDGDLEAAITAVLFQLGADGEWAARIVSAVIGTILLVGVWAWMRPLGQAPGLIACTLLAFSPLAVASARSAVPGEMGSALALMASAALLRSAQKGGSWPMAAWGLLLGLALASDEAGVVGALAVVTFLAWEIAWGTKLGRQLLDRLRAGKGEMLALTLSSLVGLGVASWLASVSGKTGLPGLRLWAEMFGPSLEGGARPFFWVWLGYDPLLLLFGLTAVIWLLARWRKMGTESLHPKERFLVVWTILGAPVVFLATRGHAGEGMALVTPGVMASALWMSQVAGSLWRATSRLFWLAAVLALIIGAWIGVFLTHWSRSGEGMQVEALLGLALGLAVLATMMGMLKRREQVLVPSVLGIVLGGAISLHGSVSMVFGQGREWVLGLYPSTQLHGIVMRAEDLGDGVTVDPSLAWLGWYLRHLGAEIGDPGPRAQAYIGPAGRSPLGLTQLGEPIPLAVRWGPASVGIGDGWRWLLLREASAVGEVRGQLFVRG